MKAKNMEAYIVGLPDDVRNYILQDLPRWIEVLKYKGAEGFVHFYRTRQEFRSLIRYRARVAEKTYGINNVITKILTIHGHSPSAWVSNLYLSCEDIGPGLYIEHGFSTIVFAKTIGKNFHINQNVTIGSGKGGNPGQAHINLYEEMT